MRQHWFPIEKLCSKKAKVSFINTTLDTPQNSGKGLWYFFGNDYNVIIIILVLEHSINCFIQAAVLCKHIFRLLPFFLKQRSIGFHNCPIFLKLTKFDCSLREEKSKHSIKHFFNLNGSLRVLHCISSLKSLRKLERFVTLLCCPLSIQKDVLFHSLNANRKST